MLIFSPFCGTISLNKRNGGVFYEHKHRKSNIRKKRISGGRSALCARRGDKRRMEHLHLVRQLWKKARKCRALYFRRRIFQSVYRGKILYGIFNPFVYFPPCIRGAWRHRLSFGGEQRYNRRCVRNRRGKTLRIFAWAFCRRRICVAFVEDKTV